MSIKLIVADDHPLVLDALDELLSCEPDITVVARCRDGEAALAALRDDPPDVLVLDLSMPGMGGLGVLRELAHEKRAPAVVLYTVRIDPIDLVEARRLGVRGVVIKGMPPSRLIECIRALHAGDEWFPMSSR